LLLFLLVMTLNSEAKYSSGGGGDPLGSSMYCFSLSLRLVIKR
jgi:hypothetical protein